MWVDSSGQRLRFQITANRFLTGMIRIIVGRGLLLEVGTGRMDVETFEQHLRTRQTPRILTPAYPQGLYLSNVYPYGPAPTHGLCFRYEREGYWQEV